MEKNIFEAQRIGSPGQWWQIYRLYKRAFPKAERKPFAVIWSMWRKGKTDIWCFSCEGRFAGFATTVKDVEIVLIDYLAVEEKARNGGIGTHALEEMKRQYAGKGIFVEIESMYEQTPDAERRMRRKRFYLRNGFVPMNVMADVFGVKMELMVWQCRVDFARYKDFYRSSIGSLAEKNVFEAEHPEGKSGASE